MSNRKKRRMIKRKAHYSTRSIRSSGRTSASTCLLSTSTPAVCASTYVSSLVIAPLKCCGHGHECAHDPKPQQRNRAHGHGYGHGHARAHRRHRTSGSHPADLSGHTSPRIEVVIAGLREGRRSAALRDADDCNAAQILQRLFFFDEKKKQIYNGQRGYCGPPAGRDGQQCFSAGRGRDFSRLRWRHQPYSNSETIRGGT
mmetsp:Transcript_106179/g.307258  ORF Transcript_106179/g.307258 Transcript_106179/m.307258 type:complete len:200 (+) Transcript_106179:2084-2683(+)